MPFSSAPVLPHVRLVVFIYFRYLFGEGDLWGNICVSSDYRWLHCKRPYFEIVVGLGNKTQHGGQPRGWSKEGASLFFRNIKYISLSSTDSRQIRAAGSPSFSNMSRDVTYLQSAVDGTLLSVWRWIRVCETQEWASKLTPREARYRERNIY